MGERGRKRNRRGLAGLRWDLAALLVAIGLAGSAGAQPIEIVPEELTPFAAAHESGGAVVYRGRLHVWTGYTDPPNGRHAEQLERLNDAADAWVPLAPTPHPRNGVSSFLLEGLLYQVAGEGPTAGNFTSDVVRYDPTLDAWEAVADFPTTLWSGRGEVVDGRAFVIGGRHGYTRTHEQVFEYEPLADEWIARANMPLSSKEGASVVHEGRIWMFGGEHKDSESHSEWIRDIQIYDPVADTWEVRADAMPWAFGHAKGFVACDRLAYLVTTSVWNASAGTLSGQQAVYRYDFETDQWDDWARLRLPTGLTMHVGTPVALLGGRVYLLSVFDGGERLRSAFRFDLDVAPVDPFNTLRLRTDPANPQGSVELDWRTATALRQGETRRVLRASSDELAVQPFVEIGSSTEFTFVDATAAGELWFYDVRTADCSGALSDDPYPPSQR